MRLSFFRQRKEEAEKSQDDKQQSLTSERAREIFNAVEEQVPGALDLFVALPEEPTALASLGFNKKEIEYILALKRSQQSPPPWDQY